MPFSAYYLASDGELRRDLTRDEIASVYKSAEGLLWVDFTAPNGEESVFMEQTLGFHHLAVEDCLSRRVHSPKIDDFGEYLFIVVHGIDHEAASDIVQTTELALFLGPHFVVSSHVRRLHSIDAVAALVVDDARPMRRGADFLAHALIDSLIDYVLPTIDRMEEVAEGVQEQAISEPEPHIPEAILKLKRSTLRIHRVMAPQRELMNRLARGEFALIKDEAFIFYRDIYDHMVRIEDLNQTIRDEIDSSLTTYLSSVGIQQNETTKVLSAVASIFLPLSLVAGIYGMNFDNMPELRWDWAYFVVVGLMAVAIAVSGWWFWANGWIRVRRRRELAQTRPFAVAPETLTGYVGSAPRSRQGETEGSD